MTERPEQMSQALSEAALLAAVGVAALVLWLGPSAAVLLHAGRLELLGVEELMAGWLGLVLDGRWTDPGAAFGPDVRVSMPGGAGFVAALAWVAALVATLQVAVWRTVDARASRAALGRRSFSLRGARPRAWARARDLRDLQVRGRPRARMALGTIGRPRRLLAAGEEMHVALLAPTGAGKTSGLVIPWVLEAPGPVISLSVKPDVYAATRAARAARGRVWVWDPFGAVSCGWSPLLGCERWSGALRRATSLADAGDKDGTSEAAVFWKGEGAKLLAPLLHAAAGHDLAMGDVLRWLDERDDKLPLQLLHQLIDTAEAAADAIRSGPVPPAEQRAPLRRRLRGLDARVRGARSAAAQLEAILSLDGRNAGTTYMSAAALLAAYRYPEVQATESRHDFCAQALLDDQGGQANSLYIVAGAEDQALLAPVIVALLSEVMALGARRAAERGAFAPTVRVVGDELANIAPIRSLPRYLATLRASGFRFAVVAQNIAQLRAVYGTEDVDTILTNCQAKLFLGPISCTETLEYLGRILGEVPTLTETHAPGPRPGDPATISHSQTWRPRASPQDLQQLGDRRALLVHGTAPAAVIRTVPWWQVDQLAGPRSSFSGKSRRAPQSRP